MENKTAIYSPKFPSLSLWFGNFHRKQVTLGAKPQQLFMDQSKSLLAECEFDCYPDQIPALSSAVRHYEFSIL